MFGCVFVPLTPYFRAWVKASMDVEVAIGAASSLGRLASFGQRTPSIAASVEIVGEALFSH
jgi:hypothetical protein